MALHDKAITKRARAGTAEAILAHSPAQLACRLLARNRLCVLAYHGVSDADRFSAHLDWLCSHATPVGLEDVERMVLAGEQPAKRQVLVTFDDGDRSVLEVAAPLLRERGIPGVAFVIAGLVDTDTPFWWIEVDQLVRAGAGSEEASERLVGRLKQIPDEERRKVISDLRAQVGLNVRTPQLTADELRKLELDGIAVGNHSLTHPCLDRCDDAILRQEVFESHDRLTVMLGHPPRSFAYPNGNWDRRVRRAVEDAGHTTSFAFDHRLATVRSDHLAVSRVRVDSAASLDRFKIMVSGLHPALHRMRGRR